MNLQTSANICKHTQTNALVHDTEHDTEVYKFDSDESNVILEHWNTKNIIKHRMTPKLKRAISGALRNYSSSEIQGAIDNYAKILASPAHWFSYKWTLADFLGRGVDKFIDWRVCDANYKKDNGGGNGTNREDIQRHGTPGNQPSGAFDDIKR